MGRYEHTVNLMKRNLAQAQADARRALGAAGLLNQDRDAARHIDQLGSKTEGADDETRTALRLRDMGKKISELQIDLSKTQRAKERIESELKQVQESQAPMEEELEKLR